MKTFFSIIKRLLIAAGLIASFFLPTMSFVHAADTTKNINSSLNEAGFSGFGMTSADARAIGLGGLVGTYVTAFLGFVGTIAFVVFLYGGYLWLTARGNDDQVADAKKYLFNGTIGIAVIVLAYSAAYFITSQLYKASSGR